MTNESPSPSAVQRLLSQVTVPQTPSKETHTDQLGKEVRVRDLLLSATFKKYYGAQDEHKDERSDREIQAALLRQSSYSSFNELHACERRYYLDKLTSRSKDATVDTAFGHAVAAGIQHLWLTGNVERAKAAVFFAWNVPFEDDKPKTKKSISYSLRAFEKYIPFWRLLSTEWELATIDGVSAVEYSLLVILPDGFRYRAYIDFILRHKETGIFEVNELKTSGSNMQHEAQWANSAQGLAYNLVIDHVAPDQNTLWAKYWVYHSTKEEWVPYEFPKSLADKARWLKTLLVDIRYLQEREKAGYWPMRGQSCFDYGKPCRYFGSCQFADSAVIASRQTLEEKLRVEEEKKYSFVVPLESIVDNYLAQEGELE